MPIQGAFGGMTERAYGFGTTGPINATGGTITTSGGYKYHTFLNTGSLNVLSGAGVVDVLLVAGGGGGGSSSFVMIPGGYFVATVGGGGGAGGLVNTSIALSAQNYTITVGGGGPGNIGDGTVGSDSTISTSGGTLLTAYGGGYGQRGGQANGGSGGSGGGAGSSGVQVKLVGVGNNGDLTVNVVRIGYT